MLGMQARIRLGSIARLPLLLLLAVSCTPDSDLPSPPSTDEGSQPATASPSLPAEETPTSTPHVSCTIQAQTGLTAYHRPDLQAEVFAEIPAGTVLTVLGTTESGWIGFDPQTAQAGNIGPFRLRWLPPGGRYELTGSCQDLPLQPSLPARTCFTMAMGAQPIYAAASLDTNRVTTLDVGDYAGVVSRTPDGWLELTLAAADASEPRPGWMPAEYANFNGPCSAFSPPQDVALIEPYAPGTSPAIQSIQMVDDELGWAVAGSEPEDDHLLRTTDGGLNWSDITPPEYASRDASGRKQLAGSFHANGSAQVAYYSSRAALPRWCSACGRPAIGAQPGRALASAGSRTRPNSGRFSASRQRVRAGCGSSSLWGWGRMPSRSWLRTMVGRTTTPCWGRRKPMMDATAPISLVWTGTLAG